MMNRIQALLWGWLLIFTVPSAWAEQVRIAVASNFLSTAQQLAQGFESQSPHQLKISAASSGKFFAQIRQGAPYDLFFSADAERPQKLFAQGIGIEPPQTYALGQLVLWQPATTQAVDQQTLKAFNQKQQRIALANPRLAPYGRAAQEVLQHLELWRALKGRSVRGENIAQAFHYVRSANVAMGFVALSQIRSMAIPEYQWWRIPGDYYSPIEQQVLLLQSNAGAMAFWQYLQSAQAKAIIQHNGYGLTQ